ncbi:alpha/beta-hydrolase, partial [Cristinia sonorae]
SPYERGKFHASMKTQEGLCGEGNVARSGFIGLKGDQEDDVRRSFYWLFEAQRDSENAPVILTHGGGPGTSGLMNPLLGQSHCKMLANGSLVSNPNTWAEKYNLLALDHPIGAGFSVGFPPNSAKTSAVDVYDFLQKFYVFYPQFIKNKLIIATGSYGGMYTPHIATYIHKNNLAITAGKGEPGAMHINLEALMVSNPISDSLSHYRWLSHGRCYNPIFNLYNETTCEVVHANLPACLDAVQYALDFPSAEERVKAIRKCREGHPEDLNGRMLENVKIECDGSLEGCAPEVGAIGNYLNQEETKAMLGVPLDAKWEAVNKLVWQRFFDEGDMIQRAHLLYGPLVSSGIRLLHYVGYLDENCGWQGIFNFLKYIQTPYRETFINSTDVQWHPNATVRAVGDPGFNGAGNFTWILMSEAGHLVVRDQPELVKSILETWVDDKAWI